MVTGTMFDLPYSSCTFSIRILFSSVLSSSIVSSPRFPPRSASIFSLIILLLMMVWFRKNWITLDFQSLYDSWSLMFYNIFYTSCPVFTYGLQEQPFSSKTLMHHPMLYQTISRNALLAWKEFFLWSAFAIWHSIVCFFVPYFSWSFFTPITDWSSFGTLCFVCVVAVVNMKVSAWFSDYLTNLKAMGICSEFKFAESNWPIKLFVSDCNRIYVC